MGQLAKPGLPEKSDKTSMCMCIISSTCAKNTQLQNLASVTALTAFLAEYQKITILPSQTKHSHLQITSTTTTILRPFFRDNQGEPVSEENFWTLWCKERLTEADTQTIRLGATPSRLTSAHLHHPPIFFTGRMPFLPPNQQCQSTENN